MRVHSPSADGTVLHSANVGLAAGHPPVPNAGQPKSEEAAVRIEALELDFPVSRREFPSGNPAVLKGELP
jgi:hypothetical protein